MVMIDDSEFPAWKKHPDETYEEFKKRFGRFHRTILKKEYKKDEANFDKIMRYRAWDRIPGESIKDFKRRLKSEKRNPNTF